MSRLAILIAFLGIARQAGACYYFLYLENPDIFRDRWDDCGCSSLDDTGSDWQACCVPIHSTATVPATCTEIPQGGPSDIPGLVTSTVYATITSTTACASTPTTIIPPITSVAPTTSEVLPVPSVAPTTESSSYVPEVTACVCPEETPVTSSMAAVPTSAVEPTSAPPLGASSSSSCLSSSELSSPASSSESTSLPWEGALPSEGVTVERKKKRGECVCPPAGTILPSTSDMAALPTTPDSSYVPEPTASSSEPTVSVPSATPTTDVSTTLSTPSEAPTSSVPATTAPPGEPVVTSEIWTGYSSSGTTPAWEGDVAPTGYTGGYKRALPPPNYDGTYKRNKPVERDSWHNETHLHRRSYNKRETPVAIYTTTITSTVMTDDCVPTATAVGDISSMAGSSTTSADDESETDCETEVEGASSSASPLGVKRRYMTH